MVEHDAVTLAAIWSFLRWPLAAGLVAAGARLALRRLSAGRAGEIRVAKLLTELKLSAKTDVFLPTPRGGLTQVDHLVLTGEGIFVIETKNFGGVLRGDPSWSRWQQRTGQRTRSLHSPLVQNAGHVEAAREIVGLGIPVRGMVIFAGNGRFPHGQPEGTFDLAGARERLAAAARKRPSWWWQVAWLKLKHVARTDRAARQRHLRGIHRRHGRAARELAGWVFMGTGLALASFSLLWS